MGLKELKTEIIGEVNLLQNEGFTHDITTTKFVPDINDAAITYPNYSTMSQKSKLLESAILFVDMRGSTALSMNNQDMTELAPLYSAFVRAMSKCAHYYNGKVRNIIGDRVMVVFDREKCYLNAINTAILMNSVVKYVLDPHIANFTVKAGIGIDFGKMLVTKNGVIKQGDENDPNKALVWLGKPANVASKLTDLANKSTSKGKDTVIELYHYPNIGEYGQAEVSLKKFMGNLDNVNGRLTHENSYCYDKVFSPAISTTNPPILITKYFYDQYVKEHPTQKDIVEKYWREQNLKITGYPNKIFGGDVFFTDIKDE